MTSHYPTPVDPLVDQVETELRLKIFSSAQRKRFFTHLKGAEQIHFASKPSDSGKCRVTSIHPPGIGHIRSKHDVTMYTDDAFRLRRRVAKLRKKILISGRINP